MLGQGQHLDQDLSDIATPFGNEALGQVDEELKICLDISTTSLGCWGWDAGG